MRSDSEPSRGRAAGGSGGGTLKDEIARFGHAMTRMLLAGDGFTMPVLEAILGTELRVRVLRQDDLALDRLPHGVREVLRPAGADRVVLRRSCLVDAELVTVSVNHVVTVAGPATTYGVDDVRTPIGYSLISRGVSQRRRIVRAGLGRWLDGRACATKAYVILLDDRPLCYIRESFNPDIVPAEHASPATIESEWDDEPDGPAPGPTDLASAVPPAVESDSGATGSADRLRDLPPLVHPDESAALITELARAGRGEAFVLHLVDRGEPTAPFHTRRALAHAVTAVLAHGLGADIVTVAHPTGPVRPNALEDSYFHAAATLNYWRGSPPPTARIADLLRRTADRRADPLARTLLRDVAGLLPLATTAPHDARELFSATPPLHVGHDAAHLPYEAALTRRGPDRNWWNCATALLWLGPHAHTPAHLEYAARTTNPIAISLSPTTTPAEITHLCRTLNPHHRPGRLLLIAHPTPTQTPDHLTPLLTAPTPTPVTWLYAPGPTPTTSLPTFLEACRTTATPFGGLHLESPPPTQALHTALTTATTLRPH
ncbi:3-deoxy-7-phosphoheptulonate synthase [Nocardia sp. NPDC004068]|uniref:3-deoxy-7-phosphoheptulonate synthase n=1 Tax=Nocardia sp. NPDC004068 TaxID=3364303 RepID=UPI0036790747